MVPKVNQYFIISNILPGGLPFLSNKGEEFKMNEVVSS